MVTREIQIGFDSSRRARQEAQAAFISDFLRLAFQGNEQPFKTRKQAPHSSAGMDAVREGQLDGNLASRNVLPFTTATERLG